MSTSIEKQICKPAGPPQPPADWKRCRAYMERKNRFCKQWPNDGKLYCGNHQHLEENFSNENKTKIRKRIPCPIDPSHMIFEDNVRKHILICPRAKKRKRQEEEPYFLKDINCGGHGRLETESKSHEFSPGTSRWAQRIARRVLRSHQSIFKDDKTCDVTAITNEDIHGAIPVKDLSADEMQAGIREGFLSHHIKSGGEHHTTQIASLIGHLRQMGFFQRQTQQPTSSTTDTAKTAATVDDEDNDVPLVVMEMGAGRGMFGLTAAGVANASGLDTHFFMVDRAGSRSKAEKAFRNLKKTTDRSYLKLDEVNWCRLCCDVSHVNLPVVLERDETYSKARILVIAKHLCGAGTDLALKSLIPIREKINACLIATCCHGICSWEHYVGRDILRRVMEGQESDDDIDGSLPSFGPEEFDLLRRWSGATVATRTGKRKLGEETPFNIDDSLDEDEHTRNIDDVNNDTAETNISPVVRELGLSCSIQGLGRACQRLIDHGRSEYIHQNIFGSDNGVVNNLTQYVRPEVTPQNAILWAYRKDTAKEE